MIFVIFCKKKKLTLRLIKEYTSRKCPCKAKREREGAKGKKKKIEKINIIIHRYKHLFLCHAFYEGKKIDKGNTDEYKRKNLLINANYKGMHT